MGKVWPLLLALFVSGLALSLGDASLPSDQFVVTDGVHQTDAYVRRMYDTWNIETKLAIYSIEKYDFSWDWKVSKKEAVEVANILDAMLQTIASYSGTPYGEKVQVAVVSMDAADASLEFPYAVGNTAFLTFQHIREGNYVEALSRAYLHAFPPWLAIGVSNVITGDILSDGELADYFTLVGSTDLLRLTGVRFYEAICGEYDVAIARGAATSLVRYIKRQCVDNTLLQAVEAADIGEVKRAWLDAIGVTIPYAYEYEIFWNDIVFYRNALYNIIMEHRELRFHINWNAGDIQISHMFLNADALEQLMITSTGTLMKTKGVLAQNAKDPAGLSSIVDAVTFVINEDLYDYFLRESQDGDGLLDVVDAVNAASREVRITPQGLVPSQTAYVAAHGVMHIFMPADAQWLQEGLANYIAMTLPREQGAYQNLDSVYDMLCAAKERSGGGAQPDVYTQAMRNADAVLACYENNGGSLASREAFDPVLYTHAAAFCIAAAPSSPGDENFSIGEQQWNASATRDAYTSFVCFLVDKYSLRDVMEVAQSYERLEEVFGKRFDALMDEWKAMLMKYGK